MGLMRMKAFAVFVLCLLVPTIALKASTSAQLRYLRDGHCKISGALDPALLLNVKKSCDRFMNGGEGQLRAFRQKVAVTKEVRGVDLLDEQSAFCREFDTVKKCKAVLGDIPFLQYFNVWREDEVVRSLSTSPELAELASSLMRVRRVRLYQDSLFLKRVGDGCTNYHSDLRMAPFDTNDFVTFWIPLVDIPRFGSALVFVSGSHNDMALNFWRSRKQVANMDLSKRYKNAEAHHMPLSVGDITAHSGWVLHSADGNVGPSDRLALAVSYVSADAVIRKGWDEFEAGHEEDFASYGSWVKDVKVGKRIKDCHPSVPVISFPRKE